MQKYIIIIIAALSLLFTACEKEIEIDYPAHESVLVVNTFCQPDSTWKVYITDSQSKVSSQVPQVVENASVQIFEDESLIATLYHEENGQYIADDTAPKPQIGSEYTLKVSADGYPDTEANTSIPVPVDIQQVEIKDSIAIDEMGEYITEIHIHFQDPPETDNFYSVSTQLYNSELGFYWPTFYKFDGAEIEFQFARNDDKFFFSDLFFNGTTYVLKAQVSSEKFIFSKENSDQIIVNLASVTESYYNYHKEVEQQISIQENPFAEPVFIESNIQNGLGNFAGFSISQFRLDF